MASTIAYGLTESGGNLHVNEDALYLAGRIKPELIGGREVESGRFTDRRQLFLVTDGFGGPGAGDLAGRLVFQVAAQHLQRIPADPETPFDFPRWVRELMAESDRRISQELQSRSFGQAGCSVGLLFLIDSFAYTMTLGSASVYLCRGGDIYLQAAPQESENNMPLIHLGKRRDNDVPVAQNIKKVDLQKDDQFLLLTDGAYRHVTAAEIRAALTDQQAFTTVMDKLFDLAGNRAEAENKTMLAVRVTDVDDADVSADINAEHAQYRRPSDRDVERFSRAHREAVYDKPQRSPLPPEPRDYRRADESRQRAQAPRGDTPVKGSLVGTFLKSLLLGFLIGLAIMLTVWFIFLS